MKKIDFKRFVTTGCCGLLFLLYSAFSEAQTYHELSESQQLALRLHSYVLIDIATISAHDIPYLKAGKSPVAIYLSDYKKGYEEIFKQLANGDDPLLILGPDKLPEALRTQLNALFITDETVETLTMESISEDANFLPVPFSKDLLRVIVGIEPLANETILQKLWIKSGRMPNFIQTKLNQFKAIDSIVFNLNLKEKVFGTVSSKEGLLKEVGFKGQKDVLINGVFSFPITDAYNLPIFIPQKPGYYFSPDIIYTTPDNKANSKEFMGFPLDADYGLTDHFIFRKTIANAIRKNDKELISNVVMVQEDIVHGKVGYFTNDAYIDAGLNSKSALQGSFTICAWIKPTALQHNNSILGKGDNFVWKLHEGFLTFTMADIKDYISQSSPIPLDSWSHVALVHSALKNELSFFVNGVQTDTIKLIANYTTSDYNILIGSNLWQEYFVGYITDIKIWDRELNATELLKAYQKRNNVGQPYIRYVYRSVAVLILIGIIYGVLSAFRKRKKSHSKKPNEMLQDAKMLKSILEKDSHVNKIYCFGALRILTEDGVNIGKRLSPKLKQLFLIVLLHSVKDKKGISTKVLSELLWPGMDASGVKNTRGTNIQNLRAILAPFSAINLVFRDKSWILEIGQQCYFDYEIVEHYLDTLNINEVTIEQLEEALPPLLNILKEGRFLALQSNDWLDPFIEQFSNRIIEWCVHLSKRLNENDHEGFLYDLAMIINQYDDLNEYALKIKLRIFIKQGKLSLAYDAYHNFTKLYQSLYSVSYPITFEELIITT